MLILITFGGLSRVPASAYRAICNFSFGSKNYSAVAKLDMLEPGPVAKGARGARIAFTTLYLRLSTPPADCSRSTH